MQQRIYAVTTKASGTGRLVLAQSPAQAMRHVANDLFEVKTANSHAVARLMSAGVKLEQSVAQEDAASNVTPIAQAA
jgi:hypothetical protein